MIDAHQHFWRLARGDYGWLTPALAPIHRDFGPLDLAPILARHGIERTILVQAAPTVAETEFLLAIARATPFVAGVVGWLDFEARDAPDAVARLAGDRRLVGLRPMVQDIAARPCGHGEAPTRLAETGPAGADSVDAGLQLNSRLAITGRWRVDP